MMPVRASFSAAPGRSHETIAALPGRQADACAEAVREPHVVLVDRGDPDLAQQLERGQRADPAVPRR
jgi:hypothetical protein